MLRGEVELKWKRLKTPLKKSILMTSRASSTYLTMKIKRPVKPSALRCATNENRSARHLAKRITSIKSKLTPMCLKCNSRVLRTKLSLRLATPLPVQAAKLFSIIYPKWRRPLTTNRNGFVSFAIIRTMIWCSTRERSLRPIKSATFWRHRLRLSKFSKKRIKKHHLQVRKLKTRLVSCSALIFLGLWAVQFKFPLNKTRKVSRGTRASTVWKQPSSARSIKWIWKHKTAKLV